MNDFPQPVLPVPIGNCEIEQPRGHYCSRDFHHGSPCAVRAFPPGYRLPKTISHPDECGIVGKNGVIPEYNPMPLGVPVALAALHSGEKTGLSVNYYRVEITNPNQATASYTAECSDIIEALGMDFNEGESFKAIWRKAAQRTLGKLKAGGSALYDAQKIAHFGARILAVLEGRKSERDATIQAVKILSNNLATCLRQAKRDKSYDPRNELDAISAKLGEHSQKL